MIPPLGCQSPLMIGGSGALRAGRPGFLARGHAGADGRLVAGLGGRVVAPVAKLVGQVLLVHVGTLEVGRIAVADADPVLLHAAVRRVPQVHRDGQGAAALDVAHGREVRLAGSDRLGGGGEVDGRLGEGVLGLGQADPVERLRGRDGDLEAARVGVADVLRRR